MPETVWPGFTVMVLASSVLALSHHSGTWSVAANRTV